jgi:hypothetical protein
MILPEKFFVSGAYPQQRSGVNGIRENAATKPARQALAGRLTNVHRRRRLTKNSACARS